MTGNATGRRPVVGVMGSGSEWHADRADPLGRWLATADVHLLTGGGGGVMEAVSMAFASVHERQGSVIGVVPGDTADGDYHPFPGYPNPWVEIAILTHLPLSGMRGSEPLSRNHINVLTSDVVIALPGSHGTASEVVLALRYGKPVVAFLGRRDEIPDLPEEVPLACTLAEVQAFVQRCLADLTTG